MELVSTIEISGEEREIADAYAREQSEAHTSDKVIHITSDERDNWNSAITNATKVEKSSINGNVLINGIETNVYTHPSGTNPHGTTKSDVGLGNVGNFKAVSTVANQGLSETEKSNARANIGAGTSSFSGSYSDLTNKPTIPTNNNQLTNGAGYITSSGTAKTISDTLPISKGGTGQTTGINAANALINSLSTSDSTPTDADYYISQSVGGGTTTTTYHRRPMSALWNYIKSKLATVATSGSYNDLSNKPTIPTVGNGTITIKQAGTSKGTFTMNQTGNTTIELTDNNTTYGVATQSTNGLESAADKTKLDGIATGAEVNQNAFSNVVVGSTTIAADSATDTLTLVAGTNITLTPDATNDKITISSSGGTSYTLPVATSSALGGVKSGTDITVDSSGNVSVNDDSHNHVISNVDGLQSALDGKAASNHTHSYLSNSNPTGTGSFSLNRKSGSTVGDYSFAEGYSTTASGGYSHAEGYSTTASGVSSHAEGSSTRASGDCSHAEGSSTAAGDYSHAEGYETEVSGTSRGSHAEGCYTIASGDYQHVQGKYNIEDETSAFIIGNGANINSRSNAMTVDWNGNLKIAGDITNGSGVSLNSLNSNLGNLIKYKDVQYNVTTNATRYEMSYISITPPTLDGYSLLFALPISSDKASSTNATLTNGFTILQFRSNYTTQSNFFIQVRFYYLKTS